MGAGTVSANADRILSGFKSKYHQHNSVIWKFVFLAQLILIAYLTKQLTTVLMGGGASYVEFHNNYCLENGAPDLSGVTINETMDAPCVYDYNFKKILYFWCDGISYDTADPIFANFPDNNNIFKVRHRDNPWSAWVFATFMTGKSERNMGEVKNDNLMYQFWLSGMKSFLGIEDSRTYVFDQLNLKYQTGDIKLYDGVYDDDERMFQWFFQCTQSNDPAFCVNATLNNVKAEDRSMFFESFLLDHKVHTYFSKYSDSVLSLRDQLATDIAHVKRWVDENPEYLLVVVSDHGQKVSNAEIEIHGKWLTSGNEGWMIVYNPALENPISTASDPIVLNTVDVGATLWQFFSPSGASIPAESVGKVYPVTTSATNRYKALRTNALQLRTYLNREKPFEFSDSLFDSAEKNYNDGLYEQAAVDMDSYVSELSEKFMVEGSQLPMKLPFFSAMVLFVTTIILQFGSRNGLWAAARSVGYGIIVTPYLVWILIVVFYTQASDFTDRHQIYAFAIPLLAYLASYTLKHFSKSATLPEKKGHHLLSVELTEGLGKSSDSISYSLDDISDDGVSDLGKSTEIDMPPVEEKKQFLYFEVWDHLKQKNFKEAALLPLNYILGSYKVPKSSADFWLMYAVVVYVIFSCFEIPLKNKRFLFSDIGALPQYPTFWHGLALGVLFLEFRWQRILLTSNLDLSSSRLNPLLRQLIHPAYWPLNIKTIVYFVLLCLSFSADHSTARMIYAITFVHIAVLLVSPSYLQRDLFLPLFVLTFTIDTSKEKIMQCFFVVVLQFFSNVMEKKSPCNRHIRPFVLVAMIALSHFYFAVLYKLPYSIDSLNLTVPGIEDITKYPNFSVMMMGIHYLSVFLLLVPFLVRFVTPSPPPLKPFKVGCITFGHVPATQAPKCDDDEECDHSVTSSNRRYVLTFLTFGSAFSVAMYYANSIGEQQDIPLIWAFMICTITIGYGITVVCSEMMDGLVQLSKKAGKAIRSKF